MNNRREKIALLEIGGSHDECLFTQMIALHEANCEILLVCTPELLERNPHFNEWISGSLIIEIKGSKSEKRRTLRSIWKWIKAQNTARVVFNTAQGAQVRDLCLMGLFSPIQFIGILHTTRKLKGSFTQRIINWKIKRYLFPSEFLCTSVTAPTGVQVDYFYPILFSGEVLPKAHVGLNITLLGGVERRRKDLDGFCRLLQEVDTNVHFTFLGYSNPNHADVLWLEEELNRLGMKERVQLFHHFVDHETFNDCLAKSDWILPLVHPNTPSADQYFRNQISGAMTVSFAYKIPMLLHEGYAHIEEMSGASAYYAPEQFAEILKTEKAEELREQMKTLPQCDVHVQKARFATFVLKD